MLTRLDYFNLMVGVNELCGLSSGSCSWLRVPALAEQRARASPAPSAFLCVRALIKMLPLGTSVCSFCLALRIIVDKSSTPTGRGW